jgi:hypothetical protein
VCNGLGVRLRERLSEHVRCAECFARSVHCCRSAVAVSLHRRPAVSSTDGSRCGSSSITTSSCARIHPQTATVEQPTSPSQPAPCGLFHERSFSFASVQIVAPMLSSTSRCGCRRVFDPDTVVGLTHPVTSQPQCWQEFPMPARGPTKSRRMGQCWTGRNTLPSLAVEPVAAWSARGTCRRRCVRRRCRDCPSRAPAAGIAAGVNLRRHAPCTS